MTDGVQGGVLRESNRLNERGCESGVTDVGKVQMIISRIEDSKVHIDKASSKLIGMLEK